MDSQMYTIGEMAKITNLSIQTLRYYDQIGLFKPIYVDEKSNYRYYSENQIYYIDLIKSLKYIGTSLEDIKQAQSFTSEQLLDFLTEREEIVEQKVQRMLEVQAIVKKTRKQLEQQLTIPVFNEVYETEELPQRLLAVQVKQLTADYIPNKYFSSLTKTVEREGSVVNSRYGGLYAFKKYQDITEIYYEYLYSALLTDKYLVHLNEDMEVIRMPAGRYACIAFHFDSNTYFEQYQKLYHYADKKAVASVPKVFEFFVQTNYLPTEEPVYIVELKVKIN